MIKLILTLLNVEIESNKNNLTEQDSVHQKAHQLSKLEAKIENNLLKHKKTLEFFNNNDTCQECTQSINEEFKSTKIDTESKTIHKLEGGKAKLNGGSFDNTARAPRLSGKNVAPVIIQTSQSVKGIQG